MDSVEDLQRWFRMAGVHALHACIGPLPGSRAALGRWTSEAPQQAIRAVAPHPGTYRLALMLEPLDARIWHGDTPVWGGTIGASRFRLCPPGEQGRWSQLSGCDIVNLFIPVALVDRMAALRGEQAGTLAASPFASDRMVFDLVRKMLDAQALAGPLAAQLCDHLVSALVCYLLEHYAQPLQAAPSTLGGARLRRVLRHIAQHLDAPLANAELAALCGMSAAHFSREFHRAVGLPPHRYVLTRRLERARAALDAGRHVRIVDVAEEYGFHSASHFTRSFTAHFGQSPAAWRAGQRRAD